MVRNLDFILSIMMKALAIFEQGIKNEREANIVIQESE